MVERDRVGKRAGVAGGEGRSVPFDVLQVITTSSRRGAEMFAVGLHEHLVQRGLRVATVALVAGTSPALDVEVLGDRRLAPSTLARLRRRAAEAKVVVAHGSTALPATVAATIGTPVPFVYRNIGDPTYWTRSRYRRLRSAALLRRAALVVALTDATRRQLVGRYQLDPERVVAVPTGVDPNVFPRRSAADRIEARRALGYPDEARLALCVSALSPEKAVGDAVRAVSALPDRWHLAVAGDGPDRAAVEQLVAGIGGGRVRLLGQVAEPARLMAAADVLVLPSLTEGVPGVVLEAASVGVPAVATDVGYVAEIVDDGTTGAIVPPGSPSALAAAVLRCEPDLEAMGDAAAEAARRYALPEVAHRWHDLLGPFLGRDGVSR